MTFFFFFIAVMLVVGVFSGVAISLISSIFGGIVNLFAEVISAIFSIFD